ADSLARTKGTIHEVTRKKRVFRDASCDFVDRVPTVETRELQNDPLPKETPACYRKRFCAKTTRLLPQAVLGRLKRPFDGRAQAVGAVFGRLKHDAVYENRRSKFDAVHLAVFDVAPNLRVV